MKKAWFLTILATIILTTISWYYFNTGTPALSAIKQDAQVIKTYSSRLLDSALPTHDKAYKTRPPTTIVSYTDAQAQIAKERTALADAYKNAANSKDKQAILEQARHKYIASTITLLPYWYGTSWDFYGTSTTPQQGKIACGYYVTTVLQDSGLAVERNKLAQQASENIIKSLTDEPHIKRFSNRPFDEFISEVNKMGAGLYIVGLDFHVGYLWHDGEQMYFIHSTSYPFRGVIEEPANTSHNLKNSKYRVVGKISDDDVLIKKWLFHESISTRT